MRCCRTGLRGKHCQDFTWDCFLPPDVSAVGVSTLQRCVSRNRAGWLARGSSGLSIDFPYLLPPLSPLYPYRSPLGTSKDRLIKRNGPGNRNQAPWGGRKTREGEFAWLLLVRVLEPLISSQLSPSHKPPSFSPILFPNGPRYRCWWWSRRSLCSSHSPRARCQCHPP